MQTRIAVVAGIVGTLWVLVAATLNPTAVQVLVTTVSIVAFVWAGVAFINPTWGPLSTRSTSALVLAAAICLFVVANAGVWRW